MGFIDKLKNMSASDLEDLKSKTECSHYEPTEQEQQCISGACYVGGFEVGRRIIDTRGELVAKQEYKYYENAKIESGFLDGFHDAIYPLEEGWNDL